MCVGVYDRVLQSITVESLVYQVCVCACVCVSYLMTFNMALTGMCVCVFV